jgi:hypothetical protein
VSPWRRYALLDLLIRAGVLDRYMEDATLRHKVFTAAATLPCDINDFGEVMMLKRLRESPPDVVEKMIDSSSWKLYLAFPNKIVIPTGA